MSNGPIGVTLTGQWFVAFGITQTELASTIEITEYTQSFVIHLRGRSRHDSTKHTDGIGHVGSRVAGTIEQGADETLITLEELSVYAANLLHGGVAHVLR